MKTIEVKINGELKQVELKEIYTRKIDREFNEILFGNGTVSSENISIAPMNIQKANDYIIKAMSNLTANEIDNLSTFDYDSILKEINEIKKTPNS